MIQFAGLIIALLAVAFLLRIDFVYYIVYVCLGVYAASRFLTPRGLRGLLAGREFAPNAFLGETVAVTLRLHNQKRLPTPWLEFNESIPPELRHGQAMHQVVGLKGREQVSFTYQVQAAQRGYYRLGPLRLSTGDLFGFAARQRGLLAADYLTVYPRIIPLTQLGLPSRLPFGTIASTQRLFEDPARPMGVRDYRSGDSLRQINWKVSAHTRDLVVKTFQPAISLETAVLLNLHRDDYEARDWRTTTEWAIVTAASLAAHLINQRQPVGLITNGVDPLLGAGAAEGPDFDEVSGRLLRRAAPDGAARAGALTDVPPPILPRNGRAHLMKVLERLARIEVERTAPFAQWATSACIHLSWGVTILAITAFGDEATCQALHRLLRAGFNPILIAVEPDYNFNLVRERARGLGFRAYNVARLRDLDPWRRPRRQVPV
jgi:hypothetical protein